MGQNQLAQFSLGGEEESNILKMSQCVCHRCNKCKIKDTELHLGMLICRIRSRFFICSFKHGFGTQNGRNRPGSHSFLLKIVDRISISPFTFHRSSPHRI